MLRIEFPSQRNHFQSPVHARFLTFAHFRFSILNILTFWIFIVGQSFFGESLSKLNIKTIAPLCVIHIPQKMLAVLKINQMAQKSMYVVKKGLSRWFQFFIISNWIPFLYFGPHIWNPYLLCHPVWNKLFFSISPFWKHTHSRHHGFSTY